MPLGPLDVLLCGLYLGPFDFVSEVGDQPIFVPEDEFELIKAGDLVNFSAD